MTGAQRRKWERDVLSYDPFGDDKDDGGYTLLRDQLRVARVSGPCAMPCGAAIVPGTLIRAMTARGDGRVTTIRFCHICCNAMAASWKDSGDWLEARIGAGRAALAAAKEAGGC